MLPGTPETVRVNGTATLTADPELLARLAARGRPALLAIRVHVEESFHHCAKAFIRSKLWKPETWSERLKISFGAMAVKRMKLGEDVAAKFDAASRTTNEQSLAPLRCTDRARRSASSTRSARPLALRACATASGVPGDDPAALSRPRTQSITWSAF